MNPVYIVDSIRTPRARANQKGGLIKLNPYELLDYLYKDIEQKNFLNLHSIDEVIIGCVTQYGEQAGNIAKASSLFSEYPDSISGSDDQQILFIKLGCNKFSLFEGSISAGK